MIGQVGNVVPQPKMQIFQRKICTMILLHILEQIYMTAPIAVIVVDYDVKFFF